MAAHGTRTAARTDTYARTAKDLIINGLRAGPRPEAKLRPLQGTEASRTYKAATVMEALAEFF